MGFKIGDSEIKQLMRVNENGPKEIITKSYDAKGEEVDCAYHVSQPEGEVTLRKDEAIVKHPDGSMSFFKLMGASNFEFREGLRFMPTGEAKDFSPSDDELEHDIAMIKSAEVMFEKASESSEGFEEVEDLV